MMLVVYCMVHGKIMIKKQQHIFKEAAEIVKSLRYATMFVIDVFCNYPCTQAVSLVKKVFLSWNKATEAVIDALFLIVYLIAS